MTADPATSHCTRDTQLSSAGGGSPSASTDHQYREAQGSSVGVGDSRPDPTAEAQPIADSGRAECFQPDTHSPSDPQSSGDGWLELRIWAEMFYDAQQQRIATVNRAERGGVDPDIYAPYTEQLEQSEKVVRRQLILCYRRVVPAEIQAWVKESRGLGEPLMARLLGHLGHPRWATPHHWEGTGSSRVLITDPPFERSVSQLWQYCGHGRPGRAKKGATADELAALGNPQLKMIVHLAAECCMKSAGGPYRLVYEQARQAVTDKPHTVECVRCGPSGKPAIPGSPWSAGHQHAHALRIVGKELLRDLWQVASQH